MKNKEIVKTLCRIRRNLEIKGKRRKEEKTGVKEWAMLEVLPYRGKQQYAISNSKVAVTKI